MTQYSKYNFVYHLQKWMDSVPGQTFLNYGYSWGASVVILGALFKLTHLPGANIMLYFGMGTEVIVFFLSAFDRPLLLQNRYNTVPQRTLHRVFNRQCLLPATSLLPLLASRVRLSQTHNNRHLRWLRHRRTTSLHCRV